MLSVRPSLMVVVVWLVLAAGAGESNALGATCGNPFWAEIQKVHTNVLQSYEAMTFAAQVMIIPTGAYGTPARWTLTPTACDAPRIYVFYNGYYTYVVIGQDAGGNNITGDLFVSPGDEVSLQSGLNSDSSNVWTVTLYDYASGVEVRGTTNVSQYHSCKGMDIEADVYATWGCHQTCAWLPTATRWQDWYTLACVQPACSSSYDDSVDTLADIASVYQDPWASANCGIYGYSQRSTDTVYMDP